MRFTATFSEIVPPYWARVPEDTFQPETMRRNMNGFVKEGAAADSRELWIEPEGAAGSFTFISASISEGVLDTATWVTSPHKPTCFVWNRKRKGALQHKHRHDTHKRLECV
jgi:hypothetical protein